VAQQSSCSGFIKKKISYRRLTKIFLSQLPTQLSICSQAHSNDIHQPAKSHLPGTNPSSDLSARWLRNHVEKEIKLLFLPWRISSPADQNHNMILATQGGMRIVFHIVTAVRFIDDQGYQEGCSRLKRPSRWVQPIKAHSCENVTEVKKRH